MVYYTWDSGFETHHLTMGVAEEIPETEPSQPGQWNQNNYLQG